MTQEQKEKIRRYRRAGWGYSRIAENLCLSVNTVKSYCRRSDISGGSAEPATKITAGTTLCENCGKKIHQIAKQKKKRFCCDKCRNVWWNKHPDAVKRKAVYRFVCPHCRKEFKIYGDKRRKYCSHDCYIADRFKGGAIHE